MSKEELLWIHQRTLNICLCKVFICPHLHSTLNLNYHQSKPCKLYSSRVLLLLCNKSTLVLHGLHGILVQQKLRSSTTFQLIANPSKARSKSDALSKLSRYCSEASESAIQVLKVSKYQKHFFLKLYCQNNERKGVLCLHSFLSVRKNNRVSRENGENCLIPQIQRCLD